MPASPQNSTRIYFDYNATSPLASGVADAMASALELPGNPSSPHREGRAARAVLEKSRETVAALLGAEPLDVVFTSGGTEANHLGLIGLARTGRAHVLVPPTVHPSLASAAEVAGREVGGVTPLAARPDGTLDLDIAREQLQAHPGSILALSVANHELGCLEDIKAISALCREADGLLFCDAVQAIGRIPVDDLITLADGLSVSAHKIGGPKGVGAVWLRPGPAVQPLVGGGKQESGRRPGTQALALIAGFAAACEGIEHRLADAPRQTELRQVLSAGLEGLGAEIHSSPRGLCNTVLARFAGIRGEVLVSSLDLAGFAVSTGAACSSGTTEASKNLLGIGLTEEQALEALRLSVGPGSRAEEVQSLLEVLPAIVERARRFR